MDFRRGHLSRGLAIAAIVCDRYGMRLLLSLIIGALVACSPPPAPDAPETTSIADAALATVTTPSPNARVSSPLAVSGVAPANWYFENQFPVRLLDARGAEIAFAPATPRVNWTANAAPKAFDAELAFTVTADTPATLVLQEDMPRDDAAPRELRVPIVLTPAR